MLSSQFHWWIYCEFRVIAGLCDCLCQHLDNWGDIWRRQSWIYLSLEFCQVGDMKVKEARKSRVLPREQLKSCSMETRQKNKASGQEGESWNPGKNWFGWRIRDLESSELDLLDSMEVKSCKPVQSLWWEVLKGDTFEARQCLGATRTAGAWIVMDVCVLVPTTCRNPSTSKPAQIKQHSKYYQCPAMQMHLGMCSGAWTARLLGAKGLLAFLFFSDPSTFGFICSTCWVANTSYLHEHDYPGRSKHHSSFDYWNSL